MNFRRMAQIEDIRMAAYERKYARKVLSAIKEQGEYFIESRIFKDTLTPVLEELYEKTMSDFLQRQWNQLERGSVTKQGFFIDRWAVWREVFRATKLATKITNINKTTEETIRRIVREGSEMGLEFWQIASDIRSKTGGKIGRKRARMIARTEVGEAVNLAKAKSSDDFENETGMEIGKIWIHRGAKDPRDWHVAMDNGTAIKKADRWSVSDPNTGITDLMIHPHDPEASAGNVINCGCQAIYVRWKDEN